MPDDRVENHTIDSAPMHEAAWHHLKKLFPESEINKNTQREINKIHRLREREESEMKDQENKVKQIQDFPGVINTHAHMCEFGMRIKREDGPWARVKSQQGS